MTEVLSAQRPPSPNVSVVGSRAKEKDATRESLDKEFVGWVALHLQLFFPDCGVVKTLVLQIL